MKGFEHIKGPNNQKGAALFMVLSFFAVASLGGTAIVYLGGAQTLHARNHLQTKQAFYQAEAAAEVAKSVLNVNFNAFPVVNDNVTFSFGAGEYRYNVVNVDATRKMIVGTGATPDFNNPVATRAIEVEVLMPPPLPNNLWDNVIYAAVDVDVNGNSFSVTGDVIYGGNLQANNNQMDNFNSNSIVRDPTINPLASLSFQDLKDLAETQIRNNGDDNYYSAAEVGNVPYPTSFYFQAPDPNDPNDVGIPNVVFVEGNLTVSGNDTVGGFFVVVGNKLNDPNAPPADTTMNGNCQIDGVVYSTGDFRVNGGGNNLNVNGGVLAGQEVRLNGGIDVIYNANYMNAVNNIQPPPQMTVEYWREVSTLAPVAPVNPGVQEVPGQ